LIVARGCPEESRKVALRLISRGKLTGRRWETSFRSQESLRAVARACLRRPPPHLASHQAMAARPERGPALATYHHIHQRRTLSQNGSPNFRAHQPQTNPASMHPAATTCALTSEVSSAPIAETQPNRKPQPKRICFSCRSGGSTTYHASDT